MIVDPPGVSTFLTLVPIPFLVICHSPLSPGLETSSSRPPLALTHEGGSSTS